MRSVTLFLLIFVAVLATNAKPDKKKTLLLPLRKMHRNTTFQFDRRANPPQKFPMKKHTMLFTTSVSVGTPPQTFNLVFDTSFPDILITDRLCTSWNCRDVGNQYDGRASSTFKDLQTTYNVWGTFDGIWTQEAFDFLGTTPFTGSFVRGLRVPLPWIKLGSYSGLFGLGLHRDPPGKTLIDYLSESAMFDNPVISCRLINNNAENAGDVLFGGVQTEYVDGEIQYTDVISASNEWGWRVPIADIQINDRSVTSGTAYISTGVEYVYLGASVLEELYQDTGAKLMDDRVWAVPNPFPYDVSFVIGNRMFTIPKEEIPLQNDQRYHEMYTGALQITQNTWYLGIPFVANHYVVYDFTKDQQKVGIGKRKS